MPKGNKQFHLMARAVATGGKKGEVKIYSGISTWKWDEDDPTVTSNDFDRELKALGDVDEITVRINSPGGVVTEAIAIRTALMKHPAKKTVDIEGCCDSAATLIACMPGARVRMAKGAEYMIHCCSAMAWGQKDRILSVYNSMAQTDKDMAGIYAERTGMTEEECQKLMQAETWYGAQEAKDAGFVDEIIGGDADDVEIAACAVDEDTMDLMRACYAHVPDRKILPNEVSRENSAVAAGILTENISKGVGTDMELRDATAEQIRQENPTVAQTIAEEAVTAERTRVREITALTRKGEKWQAMARKAIEEGTSVADYLKAIIAEEAKQGEEYLNTRREELQAANQVGAGDSKDNDKDDAEARSTQAAKDIAELAASLNAGGIKMA